MISKAIQLLYSSLILYISRKNIFWAFKTEPKMGVNVKCPLMDDSTAYVLNSEFSSQIKLTQQYSN